MRTTDKLLVIAAVVAGLLFGFILGTTTAASAQVLRTEHFGRFTVKTARLYDSRVRIAIGPIEALEALPGCPRYPCGRQTANLPSRIGARKGAAFTIGGDFVRNGWPVHAYVHNGRTRARGIRNGDVFYIPEGRGEAEIRRGREKLIPKAEELFGGYPQVLEDGNVPRDRGDCKNDDGPDGAFCLRQPRQGVGLSRDGERVILVEVDGRQRSSAGVLLPQFGRIFRQFGAYNALNVDGGGSAVMWSRARDRQLCWHNTSKGCLVSNPIYGERRVPQAIALVP